jgi:hypothetical protein
MVEGRGVFGLNALLVDVSAVADRDPNLFVQIPVVRIAKAKLHRERIPKKQVGVPDGFNHRAIAQHTAEDHIPEEAENKVEHLDGEASWA